LPAPTHGPGCETLFFRPARCQDCNQIVYFWGCSCGSRVLFDATEKPWPKHRCSGSVTSASGPRTGKNKSRSGRDGTPNVKFISTYTYGVSSVVCMRCGKTVRKREMDAHNYWTHGIGKKPESDRTAASEAQTKKPVKGPLRRTGYARAGNPLVACPRCGAEVLQKNLRKHLTKKCPKGKR
jgi:DNA-directed RNA polymerase subunit RPC12/RpoP